jgi:hypothetical protein
VRLQLSNLTAQLHQQILDRVTMARGEAVLEHEGGEEFAEDNAGTITLVESHLCAGGFAVIRGLAGALGMVAACAAEGHADSSKEIWVGGFTHDIDSLRGGIV